MKRNDRHEDRPRGLEQEIQTVGTYRAGLTGC